MNTATSLDRPRVSASPVAATAPRHDLYRAVHKALRSLLSTTLVRVGRIDVDDPADLDEGLDQLAQSLDFLEAHLRHEDLFVHPTIEARRQAAAHRAGEEHEEHACAITRLRLASATLHATSQASSAARADLAQHLYLDLAHLVAETHEHLHYEETVLNPLLWQLYTDDELAAIHSRLLASMAPTDVLFALRWALPAASPAERAELVAGMKATLPPEALMSVLAMIREHLDASGWIKLAQAAGVTAALGRAEQRS